MIEFRDLQQDLGEKLGEFLTAYIIVTNHAHPVPNQRHGTGYYNNSSGTSLPEILVVSRELSSGPHVVSIRMA